jgi:flagellar biosynthesis protein FliQ
MHDIGPERPAIEEWPASPPWMPQRVSEFLRKQYSRRLRTTHSPPKEADESVMVVEVKEPERSVKVIGAEQSGALLIITLVVGLLSFIYAYAKYGDELLNPAIIIVAVVIFLIWRGMMKAIHEVGDVLGFLGRLFNR